MSQDHQRDAGSSMRSGFSAGIAVRRSTAKFFHPNSTLDGRRRADLVNRAPIAALSQTGVASTADSQTGGTLPESSATWPAFIPSASARQSPGSRANGPAWPFWEKRLRSAVTDVLSIRLPRRLASFAPQRFFGLNAPAPSFGDGSRARKSPSCNQRSRPSRPTSAVLNACLSPPHAIKRERQIGLPSLRHHSRAMSWLLGSLRSMAFRATSTPAIGRPAGSSLPICTSTDA